MFISLFFLAKLELQKSARIFYRNIFQRDENFNFIYKELSLDKTFHIIRKVRDKTLHRQDILDRENSIDINEDSEK